MSQTIALGQEVRVHCPRCGVGHWLVPVMLGTIRLRCRTCFGKTKVEFQIKADPCGDRTFTMDVKPDRWWG